ncbi:MAG: DUF1638 domain-containing protein [Victivallaceae bacterium]
MDSAYRMAGQAVQLPNKFYLISCAVLYRECCYCAAVSKNIIELKIFEQGLHDIGEMKMSQALQAEIDRIDPEKYQAILLGYGLCNYGIRGLHARIPLVAPRAHDCITLLLGSKEKYQDYFDRNPGTFFQSTGWTERASSHYSNPQSTTAKMGLGTYQEYVEKYGEENAKYLLEALGDNLANYSKLTYIDTKVTAADSSEREQARQWAQEKNWQYEEVEGSPELLLKLVNGEWNEQDFLVVQPGQAIQAAYDGKIVKTQKYPDTQ